MKNPIAYLTYFIALETEIMKSNPDFPVFASRKTAFTFEEVW